MNNVSGFKDIGATCPHRINHLTIKRFKKAKGRKNSPLLPINRIHLLKIWDSHGVPRHPTLPLMPEQ
jgi:hypothetical protein